MTSSTSGSSPGAGGAEPRPYGKALAGGLLALALLGAGGAVLGRPGPKLPVAQAPDSLESCSTADVVLLGNSKTRSDLPADELAAQLGMSPSGVASLTVHGSSGPVWYAVAERRVFGAGCHPRTVVAYGTLDKLLAADVSPDERLRLLAPVMDPTSPVLRRKLPGVGEPDAWGRARQRALSLREGLLGGIAAGAVGLLARQGATGRALLDRASGALFGDYFSVTPAPVSPLPQGGVAPTVAPPARAEDSFLPDLAALCAAHDARLVVIRAPLQSADREQATIAVPGLVGGARALIEQAGGTWVDLSALPLPADAWDDDVHLGALGASRLTWQAARALAGQLTEATWLLDTPPRFAAPPPPVQLRTVHPERDGLVRLEAQGRLPLSDEACTEHEVARCCSPLVVTRDGQVLPHTTRADVDQGRGWYHAEVGVLAAAGDGALALGLDPSHRCGGWWLYPGDEASLESAQALTHQSTLSLRLRTADAEPTGTLLLTLRAGGQLVLAQQTPLFSGLMRFHWPPTAGDPPLVLELSTSADASFVLLTEAVLLP